MKRQGEQSTGHAYNQRIDEALHLIATKTEVGLLLRKVHKVEGSLAIDQSALIKGVTVGFALGFDLGGFALLALLLASVVAVSWVLVDLNCILQGVEE